MSERALAVVRLGATDSDVAFDATINDPKDAPALTVDVEVADRDKDGIDDTILHLTLAGTDDLPPVETKLAFFDRPAGPSRDPEEPDASQKAIATRIASQKTKTKDMPPLVEQMRMLYRAICEEGGAPRITGIHGGSATSCGSSKPLEDAGVAEVRALASEGEVLAAFAAADIAQAAPATKTTGRRVEIDKYLASGRAVGRREDRSRRSAPPSIRPRSTRSRNGDRSRSRPPATSSSFAKAKSRHARRRRQRAKKRRPRPT